MKSKSAMPRVIRRGTPSLPYAGTSGWSGSDTSRDRALEADSSGTTTQRQDDTIAFFKHAGPVGATWVELGDHMGWHHGVSSGILSVLHREGHLCRLVERRNKCAVYVHPSFVGGRDTSPHKSTTNWKKVAQELQADKAQLLKVIDLLIDELRQNGGFEAYTSSMVYNEFLEQVVGNGTR